MSLSRHKQAHLSGDLASVTTSIPAARGTLIERLDELIEHARRQLAVAEKTNHGQQALAAVKELRDLTQLRAKATGELDERPTTVINLQSTEEWIQIRSVILEVLAPHPELRQQLAHRLQVLEGGAA